MQYKNIRRVREQHKTSGVLINPYDGIEKESGLSGVGDSSDVKGKRGDQGDRDTQTARKIARSRYPVTEQAFKRSSNGWVLSVLVSCLDCGRERKHHARGLCGSCYRKPYQKPRTPEQNAKRRAQRAKAKLKRGLE